MLDLPQLLYFKNKNLYSACQAEMRYRAVPGKRKGEDGTEEAVLTVDIGALDHRVHRPRAAAPAGLCPYRGRAGPGPRLAENHL